MKTKITFKTLGLIIKLFLIQVIFTGIVWLLCDFLGIFPSGYYIDIDKVTPFEKALQEGFVHFFIYYLIGTFLVMGALWGIMFFVNILVIRYLKYKTIYIICLFILINSLLYTKLIFSNLLQMFYDNEIYKTFLGSLCFCIFLILFKKRFFHLHTDKNL